MSRIRWRWEEKDFGFRFRKGTGKSKVEHYQAAAPGAFYVVPVAQSKLSKERTDELAEQAVAPTLPHVVPNPWKDYDQGWDWVQTADGIPLNYAGCLDREAIDRKEDEGVARAMDLVAGLVCRPAPVPLTVPLIRQIHRELMGEIYPFAGEWRTVALHKGDGPTRWPLPPGGIEPLMHILERDVLSRSPFLCDEEEDVYLFVSEVMGELLALHPFREGNGRLAFVVGNLMLMQNDLLPLDVYDRHRDEDRYFSACDEARIHKDYAPLARLIAEWESVAIENWGAGHES